MTTSHRPRKRFGQNFLVDDLIIEKMVSIMAPKAEDQFIEIGPGHGALTKVLLPKISSLTAVELDRDLAAELQQTFAEEPRFTITQNDALKTDFGALCESGEGYRLVGNLPYNISTPLLFHLMQWSDIFTDMHFMLQREVAERMAARPGSKTYGRLSVMIQYYCSVQSVLNVPNSAFYPQPKVASQVVRLMPHKTKPVVVGDIKVLERLVTEAFSHRRKRLGNALKELMTDEQIRLAGVDPDCRPETVDLAGYCALSNAVD